jgi:hypothetical protein
MPGWRVPRHSHGNAKGDKIEASAPSHPPLSSAPEDGDALLHDF